jgi:hypothetical protein
MGISSANQMTRGALKVTVLVKKISHAQMEERRKKWLCYNCDFKWHVGHKCPNPRVFAIRSVEIWEEENTGQLLETVNQETDLMEFTYNDVNLKISLHAIMGSNHPKL